MLARASRKKKAAQSETKPHEIAELERHLFDDKRAIMVAGPRMMVLAGIHGHDEQPKCSTSRKGTL